jgi:PAS domain S-box-containing protein
MAEQIRQRDRELKGNVARLESVLRASEGIITFDERGVIMAFNDSAARRFGYTPREVLGQKVHMLIRWPDNAIPGRGGSGAEGGSSSAFNAVMQAQSDITLGSRKDGGKFWMEASFSEVPLGDRKLITGIFRDITRKEDEEKIRHINAELKELNRQLDARVQARTADLENASRDLKGHWRQPRRPTRLPTRCRQHESRAAQPLNIIIGFAETIQEELTDETNSRFAPDLDKILRAARHLLALINDVLDYAKMAAGVMKLEIREFDLDGLVREAAHWTEQLLNGNTLRTELAPDLGMMRADERRVRQVLTNMLSNACKFTTAGTVTLRARRETVGGSDWVELAVRDTGGHDARRTVAAVPAALAGRLDNAAQHGGAGLGLTISRGLCEMMGGGISVTSQAGKGTEFVVRLPAVVATEQVEGTAGRPTVPALVTRRPTRPPASKGRCW